MTRLSRAIYTILVIVVSAALIAVAAVVAVVYIVVVGCVVIVVAPFALAYDAITHRSSAERVQGWIQGRGK